jgi:2-iminobutanoate/2-iminopropanoate deaminase
MIETIHTDGAPEAIGPYSQAKKVAGLVFTSGQIAIDPSVGRIVSTDIEGQTRQVCENLRNLLAASGSSLDKVVKTACSLNDIADFRAFNDIYASYFVSKPARSCVEVGALPAGALVEIEVVAEA